MRCLISGIIVAAAGLIAWPATAQPADDGREPAERGGSELRDRLREEFDRDGDGRVSDEERAAMREAIRERRERGDSDSRRGPDGELGPEGGRGPDRERGPERRRGLLGERRGDPDGAPRPEGRGPQSRRSPTGPVGRRPERNLEVLFVWFDNDGDGMLSRSEFGELSQFVQRRRRPGPPPRPPSGPRVGRRGRDGPWMGEAFGRGRFGGPPVPPRDREFGRRGRGPEGRPRGDPPDRRERDDRAPRERPDRGPQDDRPAGGPPDRPANATEDAV